MAQTSSPSSDIKRARKEAQFFKMLSQIFMQIVCDDSRLQGMFINRVVLSPSYGTCNIFFYLPEGESAFREKLAILKLYKPSMRKAISSLIAGRYTPELMFKYDQQFEKQQKIESILDSLQEEDV